MKLTIAGCGDAFGSGGRLNTCFFLETAKATLLVDCGASALPSLRAQGIDPGRVDAIVLSHLHGDHFGGLPFFLLDAQHPGRREKELVIAGPPGTRARIDAALEVFFPKSSGTQWRFPWRVEEVVPGIAADVLGHSLTTAEVIHQSGAPSTTLRLSDGQGVFAYSGDTEWTEALLPIAAEAGLFVCECYGYDGKRVGHMTWETLQPRLADLRARRVLLTHMSASMLARLDEVMGEGVMLAADGLVVEF